MNELDIRPLPAAAAVPTDWSAVSDAIGDSRIVMLGEQDHGDYGAFAAKASLTRQLYEEHGFTVLAFEACFYSLARAWQQAGSVEEARRLIPAQVYQFWREAPGMVQFWEYMAEKSIDSRPLVIAGFDVRHSAPYSQQNLIGELESFLQEHLPNVMEAAWYPEFRELLSELLRLEYQHSVTSGERIAFLDGLWNLRDSFAALDGPEASFWQQALSNLEQAARSAWSFEGRDQGMGNNVLWLARERFPGGKIIVWAHNWHVARSTAAVVAADPDYARGFAKHPDTIMGEVVAREFGEETYSLAFVAGGGVARPKAYAGDNSVTERTPPEPCSLESGLLAAGHEVAFINLRQSPAARFALGGLERARSHELAWAELYDGILFQAELR
jgi:erythromycin esterase